MTFDDHARRLVQTLFETAADRLVSDLSAAAQEEIDGAVARARHEAEQAAKAELAAVRADGEARLASAQAMNTGLLESVESARQELATVKSAAEADVARARQEAQGDVERAQRAAQADIERAQREAQADIERVRHELEEEVERLHQERAKILLARDEAAKRLSAETRRANDLAARLETTSRDREAVFERIAAAVRSIDRATTPAEILETLLDPLGHDFARAAVFMVAPSSLKGWRARGLDPTIDITKLVIARNNESLVARAATERKRLIAADGTPVIGMSGNPVPRAVALPVLAGDEVIAVAYAEDVDESSSTAAGFPRVGCKIAEMLIDHAGLRLTSKGSTPSKPSAPAFTPARQAKRVRPDDGIDLLVDGTASSLVDLSNIGAQFVSPQAMRPNRVLRMQLRSGEYSLSCKGRVMWARFEPAKGSDAAHYRVGVRFTDVDAKTVDEFLAGQGAAQAAS